MIYLDNAATTFPKPQCVTDEICKCIKKYCGNPGRSAHMLSIKSAEKIYEARELLAELFDGDAENVAFTYNTTYALNFAIKSLLKYSTHVLISDIEHNSVYRPIYELSNQRLCTFDIFSTNGTNDEIIKNIADKIKSNTKMLICTHVSNVGERRLPILEIGELCKKNGITFIVDGAQSAGIHNISVRKMNISALCIPSHKGLYGPQGVGAIIFNDSVIGRTIIEGGTGINSLDPKMPDFAPEAYEAGTPSTPSIAGLVASLKWLKDINIDKVRAHEEELYNILYNLLHSNDKVTVYKMNCYDGNTLMFNINGLSSASVGAELNRRDICVRSGFHCSPLAHRLLNTGDSGAVRVSLSVFNTKSDIYSFYDAIEDILSKSKKKIRH
jgi:cysteine desulfurase family protein